MRIIARWFPKVLLFFGVMFSFLSASMAAQLLGSGGGINDHPHNLSSNNNSIDPNVINSTTEDRICIFCHAPHGTSTEGPLWNRIDPIGPNGDGTFPLYALAETDLVNNADAEYGDGTYPNGASRLCMSCHDGVTAISEVIVGGGSITLGSLTAEGSSMAIDLSSAHPVSFKFTDAIATAVYGPGRFDLTNLLSTVLDGQGRFQCTGCHDPHNDTYESGIYNLPMWRHYSGNPTTDYDETCESCHQSAPNISGLPH